MEQRPDFRIDRLIGARIARRDVVTHGRGLKDAVELGLELRCEILGIGQRHQLIELSENGACDPGMSVLAGSLDSVGTTKKQISNKVFCRVLIGVPKQNTTTERDRKRFGGFATAMQIVFFARKS